MSDIVERLRQRPDSDCREAAAEIERLHGLLVVESNEKYLITKASLERLQEIRRLKAALREIHTCDAVDYRGTVRSIAYAALEKKP